MTKSALSTSNLEPSKITQTLELLAKRIEERFPDSSLRHLCLDLRAIASRADARSRSISRPFRGLRLLSLALAVAVIGGTVVAFLEVDWPEQGLKFAELVQVLEAGMNNVVLIGAAIFFLFSLETRLKRRRALRAIHELRAVAHIIDMHQLTKDPDRLYRRGRDTESSPRTDLTPFELSRYLDYCTEMLSLLGKIAALYVQRFEDPVALSSVNEVENLCTGLARKIWQKIMILQEIEETPVTTDVS